MVTFSSVVNFFLLPFPAIFLLSCLSSFPPPVISFGVGVSSTTPHSHHRNHVRNNETDRLSLLAFRDHLIDDPLHALSSWNHSTHFCLWEGVACGRRHQRVTGLYLNSKGLVGSLSPYIGNLSFLRDISLPDNNFQGNIPQQISQLSRLEFLNLSNNSFVGPIPTNLVRCSNLVQIGLYNNQLVGNIPTEFGSFTNLQVLAVARNNLTGGIPLSLGNISSLGWLDLGENNLDGSIPNSLGQLKSLTWLRFGLNGLSGMVPPSIYNLSVLKAIDFNNNQLQGSLPSNIGNYFPNLHLFLIEYNQFSGTLPVSLFTNVSRLQILDLGANNFVGQIPIEVGNLKNIRFMILHNNYFGSGGKNDDLNFFTSLSNCTNLKTFTIGYNNFGGRMPTSLTNLSVNLNKLYLTSNQIFGAIPPDMAKLKNLILFEASFNSLTGTIPKEIAMLQKLQYLGLAYNRLTEKIPSTIGNLTSLFQLFLSSNMLEGNVESNLGNCLSLQQLHLDNNHLIGNIPKEILFLNLLELNLSTNYLNGSLPSEMGQFKNIVLLDLSKNNLSGEIPTTLGSCLTLNKLYLAENFLQGPIPYSFGDLVAIEIIDLSRNNLSGNIPKSLENLQYLKYFNVSFNNFEGEIPTNGIFQNVTGFSINGNGKLCGQSGKFKLHKCPIQKSKKKEFPMGLKVLVGVLASLSILGTLLAWFIIKLRKKSPAKSVSKKYPNELQRISYNEIREATNGFSSNSLIGIGSFASVYKGILHESESVIAVKVFNLMERGASKSFKAECEIFRNIRHRNLLKILTVCSSTDFDGNDFKALILEFMPYGSLEDWLHPNSDGSQRSARTLNFLQRLNIAIDVASALNYLHNCNDTPIVHCDVKPSNVLLNEELVAHVGDFGLAKFLSQCHNNLDKNETNSIGVRGTVGYIPPEYGMGSTMSTKGDVYSYGIMLMEMFTGRRPTDEMFNDALSLHSFCKANITERDVDILNIIPHMEQSHNDTEEERRMTLSTKKYFLSVIEIGIACSSTIVNDRMEIKDVLMNIQKIKEVFVKIMNH